MAKIITADLYNLIKQYSKEEITLCRFAEILNEIAEKESINNQKHHENAKIQNQAD